MASCSDASSEVCVAGATGPADDALARFVGAGWVRGVDERARSGTCVWRGVPYARPPVGDLRWRAPQLPEPWDGVRAAAHFAPAASQSGRLYGPGAHNRYDASIGTTLGQPLGSEDCLYLNIWAPADACAAPARRPVLVWIHGGSHICGYTADPVYDGAVLARSQQMVVVSVAFRLGVFGFLDLDALKTGDPLEDSGNFALLDIVAALRFVQAHIASFGGDPDCVTLMGHSAGAVDACALLTSPWVSSLPAPLFHRLVSLSGGISTAASLPAGAITAVPPRALSRERGQALLDALQGCGDHGDARDDPHRAVTEARDAPTAPAIQDVHSAQGAHDKAALAHWLRAQPADALLACVRDRLVPRGMGAVQPVADGWVVAHDPIAALRARHCRAMPVLAGTTRDEARLFPALLARPDLGGVSGRRIDDAQVFARVQGHARGDVRRGDVRRGDVHGAAASEVRGEARSDGPASPPPQHVEDWIPAELLPVDAPGRGFHTRCEQLGRLWFEALRDDLLDALASRQRAVWHYRFDWRRMPAPFDVLYGAAHGFDLPFVFGNFGPSLYAAIGWTPGSEANRDALSQALRDALGAFTRTGDPGTAGPDGDWPPWPATRVFDAPVQA
jgi:para-nitrobenzyl esterase